jgi:hypothetical protein
MGQAVCMFTNNLIVFFTSSYLVYHGDTVIVRSTTDHLNAMTLKCVLHLASEACCLRSYEGCNEDVANVHMED